MLKIKQLKKIEGRIYYYLNKLFEPDFTNDFFIPNKKQFYKYTIKSMGIVLVLSLIGTSFACLESEHYLVKENMNGKLFNTILFTLISYAMVLKSIHNLYKQINHPYISRLVVAKVCWMLASFTFTMVVIKSLHLNSVLVGLQAVLNESGIMILENNVKLLYGLSILGFLFLVFEGGFNLLQRAFRTQTGNKIFKSVFKVPSAPISNKTIIYSKLVKNYHYEKDFRIIDPSSKESVC